jgi:hypothetical protein
MTFRKFLKSICILLAVCIAIVMGLLMVETLSPIKGEKTVLSDGVRFVTYEGMVHIGSQNFYEDVRQDIIRAKLAGATYLFEGINASSKDESRRMTALMLGTQLEDTPDLIHMYSAIAHISGLVMQPHFTNLVNSKDVNADISAHEIISVLDIQPSKAQNPVLKNIDLADIDQRVGHMNNWQRQVISFVIQDIFSVLNHLQCIMHPMSSANIMVNQRSQILVDYIKRTPGNLVVTYGSGHFETMFADLKSDNPNWHIVSREWRRVF